MDAMTRRSVLAGGAAALSLTQAAIPARSAEAPIGIWTRLQDMPFPVQEIYPAAFWQTIPNPGSIKPWQRAFLVNAGGFTPVDGFEANISDLVTIYDPISGEWTYGPALPEPRHHVALVYHNGFLFAVNGFAGDTAGYWRMRASVWMIQDLAAPYWTPLTPSPIPQAESVAASLNGYIHVVGGRAPAGSQNRDWKDHIDTDRHWAYDSAADRWYARRPLPTPRNSAAGAVFDGALYVIGGRTVGGGNTPVGEVYEPTSDRWQIIAPMPAPIQQTAPRGQGGLAAAVWDRKIYVFGGEWFGANGAGGVYADVWEYDPGEDKWRAVGAMPRPRHGLGAVALEDGVYVCGGATGAGAVGTTAILDRFEI